MDVKEMTISQFVQDVTLDIRNARLKSWLKGAIVLHTCRQFPQYSECDITTIIETWYTGAYE